MTTSEKTWAGAAAAVYGLILLAAMLPGSRYYVRSDGSYLRGNWYLIPGYQSDPDTFSPPSLNPDTWTAPTRASRLAAAIEKGGRHLTTSEVEQPRLKSLEAYCDANPTDVEGWAQLARLSANGTMPYTSPNLSPADAAMFKRMQALRLKSSEAGMRLDPGNAFFGLVHAGAQMVAGNDRKAVDEYIAASKLGVFRDYCEVEEQSKVAAVVDNFGDIGSGVRMQIHEKVLLPHFAFIKSVTKRMLAAFPDREPDVQIATARLSNAMLGDHKLLIECLVAASIYRLAIPKGVPARQAATSLDASVGQALFVPLDERVAQVRSAASTYATSTDQAYKDRFLALAWRPRVSASALAMTIFSFPIAFLLALWARRKAGARGGVQERGPWLHALICAVSLVAVGVLVASARMPAPGLLGLTFMAAIVATIVGATFIPPGRISSWTLGGAATVACAVIYVGTLALDVRSENSAAAVMERLTTAEQVATKGAL